MRIGKNEKKQLKLVEDWNAKHPAGIEVIVTKDDQTEQRTKTRSAAYMLGASGDYPGHTAVIMLAGISGCYALDKVREANAETKPCHFCGGDAVLTPIVKKVYICTKCGAEGETLLQVAKP